jgi:hypothetical protein
MNEIYVCRHCVTPHWTVDHCAPTLCERCCACSWFIQQEPRVILELRRPKEIEGILLRLLRRRRAA